MAYLKYIAGYPAEVKQWAGQLIAENKLGTFLLERYPLSHNIMTNNDLYLFADRIKNEFLPPSPPLNKVTYYKFTEAPWPAGAFSLELREIRVADFLKVAPIEFLWWVVAHEVTHLISQTHDGVFWRLNERMDPDCYQLDFHVRLYRAYMGMGGVLYQDPSPGLTS